MFFVINSNDINNFLSIVSNDMPVYVPSVDKFKLFDGNFDNSIIKSTKSPKDLFFTQSEDISKFVINKKNISVEEIDKTELKRPFLIFGMRACDEKSLQILDKVFLSNPIDEFYQLRRDSGIIVTLACNKFDETCCCINFNVEPHNPCGDISCYTINNDFIFEPKTQKGIDFVYKYFNMFSINNTIDIEKIKNNMKQKFNNLPLKNLDLTPFNDNKLLAIFNDEKWDELSKMCIGCGSCTFFCPTCQCYDIRDFKNNDKTITRYRCWDSCMYKDFTVVAGGGNPRKTQKERFRQRFMHKLVYFPQNNDGLLGCVGCGRCLKICPNKLNIVNVIKKFGEK